MKKLNRNVIGIVITLVFCLVLNFGGSTVAEAANPSLGAAGTFSVLAQTLITGIATISGDVGSNNATGGVSITALTAPNVAGTIYAKDLVAPSEAILPATVQSDASAAYTTNIPAVPISGTPIAVSELNGITRGPGVYDLPAGAVTLSGGVLTLDGPGTYIFRITTGLTSSGSINFINGARACDLFWEVGSLATINGTSFAGTILAGTGVHFGAGVTLDGRALAVGGDVTLGVGDVISGPSCVAPVSTATLTLVKTISGGTRTTADFPLTATGPTTITGISGAGAITGATVTAGTYTLSETTQLDYTAGTWSCTNGVVVNGSSQITLGAGDTTTCTIANTFIPVVLPVTLTLTKTVVNIGGGTNTADDFQAKIDGANVPWATPQTLSAGLHTASEVSLPNYTASVWGGGCAADGTITLVPGVNTCTITNTYVAPVQQSSGGGNRSPVPPLIDVVKVPSPLALPSGPGLVTYTYTLRNIGTVPVTDITMVGDTCSPIVLISGDINTDSNLDVTETWVYRCSTTLSKTHTNIVTATGWANGISTTDIANATVVVGASIVPPLIHVTKIPSPLALLTGAGTITYTEKITNPGTVALSNVRLTDDKCAPMRYVSGDTNNNSKLETTETWTYTCQTRLLKTTTNTATASGDANGLTARDFAIATVVVSAVPGLPKTGFPPEEKISPLNYIANFLENIWNSNSR